MYFEPEVVPLRSSWLLELQRQTANDDVFWAKVNRLSCPVTVALIASLLKTGLWQAEFPLGWDPVARLHLCQSGLWYVLGLPSLFQVTRRRSTSREFAAYVQRVENAHSEAGG